MDTLIAAYMIWASSFTGLPTPETPPRVKTANACDIQQAAVPDRPCSEDGYRVVAYYEKGTIWLPNDRDWTAPGLYEQAVILHETVHYLQDAAGLISDAVACPGETLERPAYEATFAYLAAAGIEDPMAFIGMNGISYLLTVSCPPTDGRR